MWELRIIGNMADIATYYYDIRAAIRFAAKLKATGATYRFYLKRKGGD